MVTSALPWDYVVILFVLAVFAPWRGLMRVRALLAREHITSADRIAMYGSTIAFQWLLAGVTAWRVYVRSAAPARLGLALPSPMAAVIAGAALSLALGSLQLASLQRLSHSESARRGTIYEMSRKLMPQTRMEGLPFFALICTVSLCEEFLYRGFVYAVFGQVFHNSIAMAILGSSALFAIGHVYQGRRGLVTTFILGILFAGARAWTGSLAPCILTHFVVDFAAGFSGRQSRDPATNGSIIP